MRGRDPQLPETIPLDWSTLVGSVQSYIRGLNFAAKKDMKTNAIEYGLYYVYDWLVISMKEPVLLMITPFKVKETYRHSRENCHCDRWTTLHSVWIVPCENEDIEIFLVLENMLLQVMICFLFVNHQVDHLSSYS